MKKHLMIMGLGLLALSSLHTLQAATRNYENWKANDFQGSGYLEPFLEDHRATGSDVLQEGFSFVSGPNTRSCRITWKESEYNDTRQERGHEMFLMVSSNNSVYSGWEWYFPRDNNNLISGNTKTIIWQMFCWNDVGCSNWTAHMTLEGDTLYLDYRGACVDPTRKTLKTNMRKNRWYGVASAVRCGETDGLIVCKIDGSTVLNITGLDVGLGDKDSSGRLKEAVIGVKMGMYCWDKDNYINNEVRRLYLNNMAVADRDGGASASTCWSRVEPW